MSPNQTATPDRTAIRTALWRVLHLQLDAKPHVLEDEIGLKLAAPDAGWQERPDMHPQGTSRARASIVARARWIEDLVSEQAQQGLSQYVVLGSGLDTFAQRRTELAAALRIFEVDRPGTIAWKRQRLTELGYGIPEGLHLVPVDFEAGVSWWDSLIATGFQANKPAIVSSCGVSMYLTREAIAATLRQAAQLAAGSTLAMTFMLPLEFVDAEEQPLRQASEKGARAGGTPFISLFTPDEFLGMARQAGFASVTHVSTEDFFNRYFSNRTDGLRPSSSEHLLIAKI